MLTPMELPFTNPAQRRQFAARFGVYALENHSINAYGDWVDAQLPVGGHYPLTSHEALYLCRLWQQVGLASVPADCVSRLSKGEQEGRWVVPEVGGILTPAFWEGLFQTL